MSSINLLNLAKIGLLDPVPLSKDLALRMLASAQQRLRDGELVTDAALRECLLQAHALLKRAEQLVQEPTE